MISWGSANSFCLACHEVHRPSSQLCCSHIFLGGRGGQIRAERQLIAVKDGNGQMNVLRPMVGGTSSD